MPVFVVVALAGCSDFSDPPPDPSVAPLEIVANDQAGAACSLNRTEVTEGVHQVVVVTEGVDTVVVLRDLSGAVLLEQHGDTVPQPPAGEEPSAASKVTAPELSLTPGTYEVTCRYPTGAEGTARLRVTR